MRRPVCWTEKEADGIRREIRVSFHGKSIRWQWKRSDQTDWVYDAPPSEADWDQLEKLALNWYARHRMPKEHLDRIRRLRQEARP